MFRKIIYSLAALSIMYACGSDNSSRSSADFLAAYLNENEQAILFGRVQAADMVEKADYKNIPKLNVLMKEEFKHYQAALEMGEGIHFAIEGPFDDRGEPKRILAFARVKQADSLASKLAGLGMLVEEKHGFRFAQEGDVAIGVWDNVAIVEVNKNNKNAEGSLKEAYKKCSGEIAEGKIKQILSQKADIVMGVSIQNAYTTSNTDLAKLDASKRKELENMVNDSYMSATARFENGKAEFRTENLFSDALMKRMMLNANGTDLMAKLGKGKARAGIALHLNTAALESFMLDFIPDYKREMSGLALFGMIPSSPSGKYISEMWNGELGLVAVGDKMADGSMIPEVNFHLGLGAQGKNLAERWLRMGSPEDVELTITDKEVTGSSRKASASHSRLEMPSFTDGFGKKAVSLFVDFNGLDLKSMNLSNEARFIYAFDHIWMEADNHGSLTVISAKEKDKNILKQMVNVYVKDLQNQVQNIP